MMLSVGAFISPLTLPVPKISPENLKSPVVLFVKWWLIKLEKYLKQLIPVALCFALLRIPWLGRLFHSFVTHAYGVVEGSGSKIFEELLGAGALVLMFMIPIRITLMLTNGPLLPLIWLASFSFLWVTLQYEANVILKTEIPAVSGLLLLLATTAIDFLNDLLEAVIDSTGKSNED
jgi:hypothetical protein